MGRMGGESATQGSRSVSGATAFVGRESELDALRAHMRRAQGGCGSVVLIGGEPGIGKTRLVERAAAVAQEHGLRVLWGRCWEGEGAPAFWPWIQLLRALAASQPADDLKRLMGAGAADLAQLAQDLFDVPPDSGRTAAPLEPQQARFRLFDSITAFLRSAAERTPSLVILEDVHCADGSSLRLLQYLAGEVAQTGLVVVATYRDAEVARRRTLRDTLAELARSASHERLALTGWTDGDIASFIAASTSVTPPAALVRALHAETDGNPFFVSEIVRLLSSSGELQAGWKALPHRWRIPEGVRAVIRSRFERLSASCRSVLIAAAVIGRDFELPVLQRVATASAQQVLRALDEAVDARLIAGAARGIGHYRFTHALVRETIYDDLAESDRTRLHFAVAAALEQSTGAESAEHSAALCHHYFRALPDGDAERAIRWALCAAQRASEASAHEEAVESYRTAIAALAFADRDDARHCDLLLALAEAQNRAGEIDAARDSCRAAARLARDLGSVDRLGRAALTSGGAFAVTGVVDPELVSVLEESAAAFGSQVSARHAKVLAGLSIALHFHDIDGQRLNLAARAVEMSRQAGDASAELFGLEALRYALMRSVDLDRRIEIGRQVVELADRLGDREMAVKARHRQCTDLLQRGDVVAADRELDLMVRLAAELRQPSYQAQVTVTRAMRAIMCGRFDEAEQLAPEILRLADRSHDARSRTSFWAQRVWMHRDRGGLDGLEMAVRTNCAEFPALQSWRAALATSLSEAGRVQEARPLLHALVSPTRLEVLDDGHMLVSVALLAVTCAVLEDTVRADVLYRTLLPFQDQHVVMGLAVVWAGPVTHYLGILAATARRWDAAIAHLNAALQSCEAVGAPPLAARTRLELGKALAAHGETRTARARLEEAGGAFEILGMTTCLAQAAGALRSLRGSRRSAGRAGNGPIADVLPAAQTTPPSDPAQSPARYVFRPEGDYWTLAYDGRVSRLKRRRGLQLIRYLLRHPQQVLYAMDLAALGGPGAGEGGGPGWSQDGLQIVAVGAPGTSDPLLDRRARDAYRGRLRELRLELHDAERCHDRGRLETVAAEMEMLTAQLAAALRPGGGQRGHVSATERARVSVRNSIVAAIRAIGRHDVNLERHLANSIKTGTFCSYAPESALAWQLDASAGSDTPPAAPTPKVHEQRPAARL